MAFTEIERLQYEAAHKKYLETKRRKSELPEKDRKLFEKLESIEIGRCDVNFSTIVMIADVYQNNAINAFDTIFRLGFMKGERKGRKAQKELVREV